MVHNYCGKPKLLLTPNCTSFNSSWLFSGSARWVKATTAHSFPVFQSKMLIVYDWQELKESLPTVTNNDLNGGHPDLVNSLSRCTTPDSVHDSEVSNSSTLQKSVKSNSFMGGGDSRTPSVANYPGSRKFPLLSQNERMHCALPHGCVYAPQKIILREVSTNTDPDWMSESLQAQKVRCNNHWVINFACQECISDPQYINSII